MSQQFKKKFTRMEPDFDPTWKTFIEMVTKNFSRHNVTTVDDVTVLSASSLTMTVFDTFERSLENLFGHVSTWTDIVIAIRGKIFSFFELGVTTYVITSESSQTVPGNMKNPTYYYNSSVVSPITGTEASHISFGDTAISPDNMKISAEHQLKKVLSSHDAKIRLISWIAKEIFKQRLPEGKQLIIESVNCYEMLLGFKNDEHFIDYAAPYEIIRDMFVKESSNNNSRQKNYLYIDYACQCSDKNREKNIVYIFECKTKGDTMCRSIRKMLSSSDLSSKEMFIFLNTDTRMIFMLLMSMINLIDRKTNVINKLVFLYDGSKVFNIVEIWRGFSLFFKDKRYDFSSPIEFLSFLYFLSREYFGLGLDPYILWKYFTDEGYECFERVKETDFDDMEIDQYGSSRDNEKMFSVKERISPFQIPLSWGRSDDFRVINIEMEPLLKFTKGACAFAKKFGCKVQNFDDNMHAAVIKRAHWWIGQGINGSKLLTNGIVDPFEISKKDGRSVWGWAIGKNGVTITNEVSK